MAPGDPKKSFGAFLLAVRTGDVKALEEMGSRYCEWEAGVEHKTAMGTQQGTAGGYLVPTERYDRIMDLAIKSSLVRPRATVVPMSGREVDVPYLHVATAPYAGDTAFLGGLVARWTEEATTLNESEPVFKQSKLINYALSGYSKLANSLAADAPGLEGFLYRLFGNAGAWYEDYAFLQGYGAGILSCGNVDHTFDP